MTSLESKPVLSPLEAVPVETQERVLQVVMQRQASLSLRIAALFLIPLLGLPLLNQFQPGWMNVQVSGFSLTWLLLGICFFPLTWVLSAYFVNRSEILEADCATAAREMLPVAPPVVKSDGEEQE